MSLHHWNTLYMKLNWGAIFQINYTHVVKMTRINADEYYLVYQVVHKKVVHTLMTSCGDSSNLWL